MPDASNESSAEPTPTSKASRLDYSPPPPPTRMRRAVSHVRRWARDTFSREQLVAAVKQLAWVAPLTILIWVYAEREQQTTDADVRFPVEVHSNDPNVYVRLSEPGDGYAAADFTGPRSRLEKLRRTLGPGMVPVRFEMPADRKIGDHQFPLTAVVSRDPRFEGVTISKGVPRNVTVQLDSFSEESLPVEIRKEDREVFEEVVVNPPAVKVRMPKRARDATKNLAAYVDLSALDRTPGRKSNISGVRVVLSGVPDGQPGVTIEPKTVSVSLTVRQPDQEFPLGSASLPIQVAGPTAITDNTVVKFDPRALNNVVLVGPSEVIRRFKSEGPTGIGAYVTLDQEDVSAGGAPQKEVWFRLPVGVKVKSVNGVPVTDAQPLTVGVTVTKNQSDGN
jgi:hypothetical protein